MSLIPSTGPLINTPTTGLPTPTANTGGIDVTSLLGGGTTGLTGTTGFTGTGTPSTDIFSSSFASVFSSLSSPTATGFFPSMTGSLLGANANVNSFTQGLPTASATGLNPMTNSLLQTNGGMLALTQNLPTASATGMNPMTNSLLTANNCMMGLTQGMGANAGSLNPMTSSLLNATSNLSNVIMGPVAGAGTGAPTGTGAQPQQLTPQQLQQLAATLTPEQQQQLQQVLQQQGGQLTAEQQQQLLQAAQQGGQTAQPQPQPQGGGQPVADPALEQQIGQMTPEQQQQLLQQQIQQLSPEELQLLQQQIPPEQLAQLGLNVAGDVSGTFPPQGQFDLGQMKTYLGKMLEDLSVLINRGRR